MNILDYVQWLNTQLLAGLFWIGQHLVTWSSVIQLAIIVAILIVCRMISRHVSDWMEKTLPHSNKNSLFRIHASYQEMFFLAISVLFLWLATILAEGADLPYKILSTIASLVTAWAIIRFTSSIISSPFWSRLIAMTLWVMAALNIVGWLNPAIILMEEAAISIGDFRLSMMLVFKSLLAFAILLWTISLLSNMLKRSFSKARGLTPSQRVLFHKLSTITLYCLGGVIGLNIVGIDLTALTVFSGALGLGIGFGLQKVFSNLISGIILLLDKSVKPGDVIAIGDTFGWVNSLGARCVSVLTRDGKEHLIPNENLIAQQVENWSYSHRKVRVHIPIGVSYGSDVHQVKKILLQAIDEEERILKDPEPRCFIIGFGDSSIDHQLRVWISDPEKGITNVTSAIYYRIWDLFKEHNIEIPFPQRDVHMKLQEDSPLIKVLEKTVINQKT